MKKIITLTILIIISISIQLIIFLPWWSFLIPLFLLGIILPLEKWKVPAFLFGFAAGMSVWLFSYLFVEISNEGKIINKISQLINISIYFMYLIIGLIGGVLSGLALYSGFLLRKGSEVLHL